MYPPGIQENIAKIEAGREERFKVAFKRITLEEKTPLLKTYHPDYVESAMRVIQVGPNKGERAPNELVDLLEGNSRIDPAKIDLNNINNINTIYIIMAKKVLSVTIDEEILEKWKKYAEEECINSSQLIEKLLKEHLKKRGEK